MALIQDSGSNYSFFDKRISPNVRNSKFDLSYLNTLTADEGQLIPVWIQHTLPGDYFEIALDSLIRVVNPPVVPLMSRQRVFFHTYWCSYSQLWKSWQTFMRKGQNGKKDLTIPRLGFSGDSINPRGSLLDYLGYPPVSGDSVFYFNALPLMMYLRIYRDYYKNANLDVDSDVWYPDNDEDFVLSFQGDKEVGHTGTFLDDLEEPFQLRYRDYVDDYFTSSRPWPQRGDAPVLDFDSFVKSGSLPIGINLGDGFTQLSVSGGIDSSFADSSKFSTMLNTNGAFTNSSASSNKMFGGLSAGFGSGYSQFANSDYTTKQELVTGVSDSNPLKIFSSVTAESLRRLFAESVIMEKMARTNGMYGEFIESFFEASPTHALNFRPVYVGGSYTSIVYSEVLQTSEDGNTPLGTVGGRGISANEGFIGNFRCSDYGMFMTLMSIMPDVYYAQGVQRENLYQVQEDFYIPERAELGMQPVLKGQIFFQGYDDDDYDLFSYQDAWDELRYRANEVHGKVADPDNLSFSPYIQTRFFDSVPEFNQNFVSTKNNINKSWKTATDEVPFIVQVRNRVTAVRPLPYRSIPSGLK